MVSNATIQPANPDKEAMQYLVELGRDICAKTIEPKEAHFHGEKFIVTGDEYMSFVARQPQRPETFVTYSLQGLVDYLQSNIDQLFDGPESKYFVRVSSPTMVEVLTKQIAPQLIHNCVAKCEVRPPSIRFDSYMDAEDMTVMLSTRFEKDENRDLVMKLVGNLKNEQSSETADDGFSQRVTVKAGVATAAIVTIQNPCELIPLRTFHEVEQPASPFTLRFDKEGRVALFEADGGAWKNEAVANVANWLANKLTMPPKALPVKIIA